MRKPAAAVGSAAFFVAAPCVVAGVVPWLLTRWSAHTWWLPVRIAGGFAVLVGAAVVVHSFWRFVAEGRGTPAPVAPTAELVVGGAYRYVRNPMYVGVAAAILGEALVLGRLVLVVYAVLAWGAMALFVRVHEEPALRRRYGAPYDAYREAVPGWLPRLRPWRGE